MEAPRHLHAAQQETCFFSCFFIVLLCVLLHKLLHFLELQHAPGLERLLELLPPGPTGLQRRHRRGPCLRTLRARPGPSRLQRQEQRLEQKYHGRWPCTGPLCLQKLEQQCHGRGPCRRTFRLQELEQRGPRPGTPRLQKHEQKRRRKSRAAVGKAQRRKATSSACLSPCARTPLRLGHRSHYAGQRALLHKLHHDHELPHMLQLVHALSPALIDKLLLVREPRPVQELLLRRWFPLPWPWSSRCVTA